MFFAFLRAGRLVAAQIGHYELGHFFLLVILSLSDITRLFRIASEKQASELNRTTNRS
jgi:hypothetical protein